MSGEKGKSGGRRPGAGRPAYFKCSRDDLLIVERSSLNEARFDKPELGRVVGIKAGELELQIGYDILVIRFPDDGEVQEIEPPTKPRLPRRIRQPPPAPTGKKGGGGPEAGIAETAPTRAVRLGVATRR